MNDRSLLVVVPALARPQNVDPTLSSLQDSVEREVADGWIVRLQFVCTPGDTAEIREVEAAGFQPLIVGGMDSQFPRKTNAAVALSTETFILLGADDLRFHPGWLTEAVRVHEDTGALVIGTNDLANPTVIAGRHSTHPLVHKDYIPFGTIDDPTVLLHPGYDHNSVDCEFVETAMARGTWAFAERSHVEHIHPTFNRTVRRDHVYNKAMKTANQDKRLFHSRRRLWTK